MTQYHRSPKPNKILILHIGLFIGHEILCAEVLSIEEDEFELHCIGGEGAGFIGQDVLDVAELLDDGGGEHLAVLAFVVAYVRHLQVVGEEVALEGF